VEGCRAEADEERGCRRALADPRVGRHFGSAEAIESTRKTVADAKENAAERQIALDSLLGIKDAGLATVLQTLLNDRQMRAAALRGLASYDDAKNPGAILKSYPRSIPPSEGRAQHPGLATILRARVAHRDRVGRNPSKDVSADIVRQLRTLTDKEIDQRVTKVWGVLRDSPADKKKRIAQLKSLIGAAGKTPDLPMAVCSSPRPACSATRSTTSAATSAPISPAPTVPTSTTFGERGRSQRDHPRRLSHDADRDDGQSDDSGHREERG